MMAPWKKRVQAFTDESKCSPMFKDVKAQKANEIGSCSGVKPSVTALPLLKRVQHGYLSSKPSRQRRARRTQCNNSNLR